MDYTVVTRFVRFGFSRTFFGWRLGSRRKSKTIFGPYRNRSRHAQYVYYPHLQSHRPTARRHRVSVFKLRFDTSYFVHSSNVPAEFPHHGNRSYAVENFRVCATIKTLNTNLDSSLFRLGNKPCLPLFRMAFWQKMIINKILQLIMALLLTFLVLIQSKGKGLSSSFGSSMGYCQTRRGFEKFIFYLTIFLGIAIVANSLALILLS